MVKTFSATLFLIIGAFLQTEAKYEEIERSCRNQFEFFKTALDNQKEWALEC
jgi:hypothetical protein